jgi:hypothetical protein
VRRSLGSVAALVAVLLLCAGAPAGAATRDDTDMLQAKLDAGGAIFLPQLPDGQCYATRGLWLSRDDTRITSDGACVVALGLGRAQVDPRAKKPHYANAVFDISHSDVRKPVPARVSISGLRIVVPKAKRMHGVLVEGGAVSLTHLAIAGAPLTGIRVGYGVAGDGAMSERIAITDNTVSGAQLDGIVAYGPIDLRIERNVVSSAASSGIHVRAADRGQPVIDVRVTGNTATRNRGAGIFVDLDPPNGVPVFARGIEVTGNRLVRNGLGTQRALRAGLLVAGRGEVALSGNTFSGNRGRALLKRGPRALAAQVPGRSVAPPSTGDDTAWLQSRLDRGGGTIFLPKLPGGACYATRGLWVSHDHTTITSDGACIVSLGLGPVRLHSVDGDPIAASAVFFINRSTPKRPAPVDIEISNLRIAVPPGQGLDGVGVFAHDVTLGKLEITGAPRDDITISGRANGNLYAGNVSILDSRLSGAARNAISADSVIGLDVERNTIDGVRDEPPGQPAAGIDVEPSSRNEPTLDVRIVGNTIRDNAGPGIMLELEPNEGPAIVSTDLEIRSNTVVRNARKPFPPKRAGIVLAGGQDGGAGTLVLRDNVIRNNGGPGIMQTHFKLQVDAANNDIAGNDA